LIKLFKRLFLFILVILLLTLFIKKEFFYNKFETLILNYAEDTDIVLNEVYLTGRINETKDNIIISLGISIGDPIFSINLEEIRKNINELSWVNYSKVYLHSFGQLEIEIFEHIAFCVYEDNNKNYLINNEGLKFKNISSNEFPHLFRLNGKDAISAIKDLPLILNKLEELDLKILKIERVDSRRWNIFFKQGYYIKLSSEQPWNSIDDLYSLNNNIDYNNLDFIDLRVQNRMTIKYIQN